VAAEAQKGQRQRADNYDHRARKKHMERNLLKKEAKVISLILFRTAIDT